jgi:hypothetical protein
MPHFWRGAWSASDARGASDNKGVIPRPFFYMIRWAAFPILGRWFDSHRPLQKTKNLGRCLIFHFFQNLYKTTLFQSETVKRAFPDYY